MEHYQSNVQFLAISYPALLDAFDTTEEEESEVVLTRNNEPNIAIMLDENLYFLHSRYNAHEEAAKWMLTLKDKTESSKHILLVGIGLGFFLEELLSTTKAKYIYIYEPNVKIFKTWMKVKDIRPALSDSRIKLVAVGQDEYLPLQISNEIAGFVTGSFCTITPPIYERLYPEILVQLDMKLRDMIIQQISNMQTRQAYQRTWLNNILDNNSLVSIHSSIADLKDVWKGSGIKAIVVGSGPSLKKDIHYLSQLKDKCLIIAAGSSIQAMEHFGVYPHLVVSMDGSLSNYEVFKNVDTLKVPLVFLPPVHHLIPDNYKGPMFHAKFDSDVITTHIIDHDNKIPTFISTATVTGTAIQLASYTGITEIILMGQDLSFPDDEYYAPGVNHISNDSKEAHISSANEWVDNVEGGKNRTKGNMQVLLKDIQVLVQLMKFGGVKIINTSKKGAVIEGTDWISMDELAPELLQQKPICLDILPLVSELPVEKKLDNLKLSAMSLTKVLKQITKADVKVKRLLKLITNLEHAVSANNLKQVDNVLNEINTIWQWITNQAVFKVFYNYSLAHYINIYMRQVPEIAETRNSFSKGRLIIEHLGKLVKHIDTFNPDIVRLVQASLEKHEKLKEQLSQTWE